MKGVLVVDDVKAIFGISKSMAYKIIHQLNDELKEQGYITIQGKVPKEYFYKRMGMMKSAL